MYKPQNAIEQKLIEAFLEVAVYGMPFPTSTAGYTQAIERYSIRSWDEQGQLRAILDISPVRKEGEPLRNLLDGGAFPIWLSVEIDEEKFIGGVRVTWEMPANEWGFAQSNIWPYRPVIRKPD